MATWASKLMNLVGVAVIAPPSKLGMPADFYWRIDDRPMPTPMGDTWERQRDRLFINTVRRKVYARLAVFFTVVNTAIFSLLFVLYCLM